MKRKIWRLAPLALLLLSFCTPAAAAKFEDVPETYWAAADIDLCVEQGFFSGESESTFAPMKAMERGPFAEILVRFFGWKEKGSERLPYKDIQPGDRYADAVAAALQNGAFTSQSEYFRPDDPITREELAVTLVRALGYQSIAGLAEPVPFEDVTTNTGYLGMAHNMGLMNGSRNLFMPSNNATRAQTAAVIARLYRKLYAASPRIMGIISPEEEGRSGLQIAAVPAARLMDGYGLGLLLSREDAAAICSAQRAVGAEAFLSVDGETLPREAVSLLLEEAAPYDGVFLNLSGVPETEYLRSLKEGLGKKPLYLRVSVSAEGTPYAALAEIADALVVCVPGEARVVEGFPVDPPEPLEEVYDALRILSAQGCPVFLMLTTSGNLWTDGAFTGTVSGQEIAGLLADPACKSYYSDRYACAYLRIPAGAGVPERVVWYTDADAAAARVRMARLFGAEGVFLTRPSDAMESVWDVLA